MSVFSRSSALVIGLLALALAGCQSMPVSSMLAFSRVDPLALKARDLEAAMVHPPDLRFGNGGAVLTLDAADPSRGLEGRQTFLLDVDADTERTGGITAPEGGRVTRFRLAEHDEERFDTFMATVRGYRDAPRKDPSAGKGRFSMTLNAKPCRTSAGADPLPVTAYLKARAGDRMRPVSRDVDLSAQPGLTIPSCAS